MKNPAIDRPESILEIVRLGLLSYNTLTHEGYAS